MTWQTRWWSHGWPPRRSRPAGTACSSGTTCAGGRFPVNLESLDQFAEAVGTIQGLRPDPAAPYDIAVELPAGADPAPYAAAGATWWLTELEPGVSLDAVRGVLRDGPFTP